MIRLAKVSCGIQCTTDLLMASKLKTIIVGDGLHTQANQCHDDCLSGIASIFAKELHQFARAALTLIQAEQISASTTTRYQVRFPVSITTPAINH